MNLASRILALAIFVGAVTGASVLAFEAFDRNPSFSSVELTTTNDAPITVLAGGSTRLTIGAQNTGDASLNLTLSSQTEGFTFKAVRSPTQLAPGGTGGIEGRLTAQDADVGKTDVKLSAINADTDQTIASITVSVEVVEGGTIGLTLDPTLPAALPGDNATLRAEATNPVGARQTLNYTTSGVEATVEPASVELPPNGTATSAVTVAIPSDASGSVSLTLTGETDSGSTVEATSEIPVLGPGEVAVGTTTSDLVVRPGNQATVPILVVSNLAQAADVGVTGDVLASSTFESVPPGDAVGGFARIQIPSDASGQLSETLTVSVGDATREVTLAIDTQPTGEIASTGMQARVDYVGTLTDGRVFDTSVTKVAQGPFPKSPTFRLRTGLSPIPVTVSENPQRMIAGFVDAVNGMAANESKTVVLSPDEAYGPPRTHQNLSATSTIERQNTVPRNLDQIPKNQLPPSFDIQNKTEGDILTFETTAGDVPITFEFELIRKGDQTVDLQRVAEIGDVTTFYGPWPNATEVVDVNETTVVYETTPPEDIGSFTWDAQSGSHQAAWENATTVQSMNETSITLLHQPEEGITYQASGGGQFGRPTTYRVDGVTMEEVHVSTPNNHPLAGKTLVFDITVREVREPPQRSPIQIGGGGR